MRLRLSKHEYAFILCTVSCISSCGYLSKYYLSPNSIFFSTIQLFISSIMIFIHLGTWIFSVAARSKLVLPSNYPIIYLFHLSRHLLNSDFSLSLVVRNWSDYPIIPLFICFIFPGICWTLTFPCRWSGNGPTIPTSTSWCPTPTEKSFHSLSRWVNYVI